MDANLMEHLLYEEESVELDFKGEQYEFIKADNESKSELLKDIIAFVNAWRRSTAYILIGIEEIKGSRSKVVGTSTSLDDAALQQFVNSKTQRPVEFSYQSFYFEGADVGIIEIPVQERPIYLNKDFGKLKKETVYLRRGSATVIATPDEIARMGRSNILEGSESPVDLRLEWAAIDKKRDLSSTCSVYSLNLQPRLPSNTFDDPKRSGPYGISLTDPYANRRYSQELISFTVNSDFFTSLGLSINNDSSAVARRLRFVGSIMKSPGIEIRDGLPSAPSRRLYVVPRIVTNPEVPIRLKEYGDRWEVIIDFGDIRPHERAYTTEVIHVGSKESKVARLEGEILGDNIPVPIACTLEIHFETEQRAMTAADAMKYMSSE